MDIDILKWINNNFGSNKFFAILSKIISFFASKYVIVSAVAILLIFKKTRKIGFYVMITCLVTCIINNFVIKLIVKRNRPFVDNPELADICSLAGLKLPKDYSMASGHAAVSMSFAVAVLFFSKKCGGILMAYSILVGLSRICLCVHYPTDVLVGWILGIIFAITLHYFVTWIFNQNMGDKNGKNSSSIIKQK